MYAPGSFLLSVLWFYDLCFQLSLSEADQNDKCFTIYSFTIYYFATFTIFKTFFFLTILPFAIFIISSAVYILCGLGRDTSVLCALVSLSINEDDS